MWFGTGRRICSEPLGNVGFQGQTSASEWQSSRVRDPAPPRSGGRAPPALRHLETEDFLPPHRGKEGCEHFASSLGHLTQLRELSLDLNENRVGPGTRSAFRARGGVGWGSFCPLKVPLANCCMADLFFGEGRMKSLACMFIADVNARNIVNIREQKSSCSLFGAREFQYSVAVRSVHGP